MDGENRLIDSWQTFLTNKNGNTFIIFLQQFVDVCSRNVHVELDLSRLPGFLSEMSTRLLKYMRAGLNNLIEANQKDRALTLINSLSFIFSLRLSSAENQNPAAAISEVVTTFISGCCDVPNIDYDIKRSIVGLIRCVLSGSQRQIQICDAVNRYLTAIESLHKDGVSCQSHPDLFLPLIDPICGLVWGQRDAGRLDATFSDNKVFNKLVNFVRRFQTSENTAHGLTTLLILIAHYLPKNNDANTHSDTDEEARIHVADVIRILIKWIPHITYAPDQLRLAKTIYDIMCGSERNRMVCCENHIILTVAECVTRTAQSASSSETTGVLMKVIEEMGALSITNIEIKVLLNLLQLNGTAFSSGTLQKRILQAFTYMSRQQNAGKALTYFSFFSPQSRIELSPFDEKIQKQMLTSGFTFHAWMCLKKVEEDRRITRRILYSLRCSSGGRFEAYISTDGYLTVTLVADDNIFYIHKVHPSLTNGEWHMVDIVHNVKRGSKPKWTVDVYVNGELNPHQSKFASSKHIGKLSCAIGGLQKTASTMAEGETHDVQFGRAVSLQGKLASVCIFQKALKSTNIQHIYNQGVNHMELFTESDIKPDLILYLHPKEMLKCMGGFEVIVPILEQTIMGDRRDVDDELFERDNTGNCLSRFLGLLETFMDNAEENADQLLSANSVPIIGALMQKVNGSLIDESTLKAVKSLLSGALTKQPDLYNSVIHHILLDFRIWNSSNQWAAKVAHAKVVKKLLKEEQATIIQKKFGVQFMLDTIRQFYCVRIPAAENEMKTIRELLFRVIKFCIRKNPSKKELQTILLFVHSIENNTVVMEAINNLQEILDDPLNHCLTSQLSDEDTATLLYTLLIKQEFELNVKQSVAKFLVTLLSMPQVPERSKKILRLERCGMGGLVSYLKVLKPHYNSLTLQLMTIACGQGGWEPSYPNIMSVLSLSQNANLLTKLALASKLLDVLQTNTSSVTEIVGLKGWQDSILCLLLVDSERRASIDEGILNELQIKMLDIHNRLMWRGLNGFAKHIWKERLKVFYSLKSTQGLHFIETTGYSRVLIEYMLKQCCNEVHHGAPRDASCTQNGQQLVKLVYDFINTYGSSRNTYICYGRELLHYTIELLQKMTVWHRNTGWPVLAKIALSVLVKFATNGTREVASEATKYICQLIDSNMVRQEAEIHYLVHASYKALVHEGLREYQPPILQLFRDVLEKHADLLELRRHLPSVNIQNLDDTRLLDTHEWRNYIEEIVTTRQRFFTKTLEEFERELQSIWVEVEDDYRTDCHRRLKKTSQSVLDFQESIRSIWERKIEPELNRCNKTQISLCQNTILREWKNRKRIYSKQHGIWSESLTEERVYWMMSSHENYSRMRLKLIPDYRLDDREIEEKKTADTYSEDDPEECSLSSLDSPSVSLDVESGLNVNCELIARMDPIPGQLVITNSSLCFYGPDAAMQKLGGDCVWPLSMLSNIQYRLRNLDQTALELFLHDGTNHFLNFFTRENQKRVVEEIERLKSGDAKFRVYGSAPAGETLRNADLTPKWVKREISNFDYLMQLNTIAGRTNNDLNQYFVFPWVLKDYTGSSLDMSNPAAYRDLAKPAGALRREREIECRNRYRAIADRNDDDIKPYHHATHYSSAAGVVTHFLVRMEPFASGHRERHGNRFDEAERLFSSVEASFRSVQDAMDDCREIIPEFYYLPDFLVNTNEFDLGRDGGDVGLPIWSCGPAHSKIRNADDFVRMHRMALESDYVSDHLHHWIDLIFGYKQRGDEAVAACNVYPEQSYPGASDLPSMSEEERKIMEDRVNSCGQIPIQLCKEPHPERMKQKECIQRQISDGTAVNILPYLGTLKLKRTNPGAVAISTKSQLIYKDAGGTIFAAVPPSQDRPLITGFDTLVTISDQGCVGAHKWQPVDGADVNKFMFERDDKSDKRRLVDLYPHGKKLEHKLVAVCENAKKVYMGGFWDNSLRVYKLSGYKEDKMVKQIKAHNGVVTCLHLDSTRDGEHLVTGSADTTCKIWEAASLLNDNCKPLQCLHGHNDEVTCVAISTEYDMVVSGSKDGTINIHTIRKGMFIQSIALDRDMSNSQLVVREVALSSLANIILYTEETSLSSPQQVIRRLLRYSVNGHLLDTVCLDNKDEEPFEITTQLLTAQDHLIYGTSKGKLYIREIHGLKGVTRVTLSENAVRSVSVVHTRISKKHSHLLVGLEGTPGSNLIVFGYQVPKIWT